MFAYLFSGFEWLKKRWGKLNAAWRVTSAVGVFVVLYLAIAFVPSVPWLKDWYSRARPETQLMFLIVCLAVLLICAIVSFDRWYRVNQLETEKADSDKKRADAEVEVKRPRMKL